MLSNVELKSIDEVFSTPIIQQTAFWSEVKKRMGTESEAFNFKVNKSDIFNNNKLKGSIVSDFLVINQRLDSNHSVAYLPYGPELEPDQEIQGAFLEELSESLRSHLPQDCMFIRYDLVWESLWANDDDFYNENGMWLGPPDVSTQEFRFNYTTTEWNFKKAGSNILPSNTIFIDLKPDETAILAAMKPKTRYNIGLSARKGVTVRSAGIDDIDIWYKLYAETAVRNNFYLHKPEYFTAVLTANADNSQSPAEVELLIAEHCGVPLAAMFLVITGNRGTYLYGASSSSQRELMATYAMQWHAIKLAKQKGCVAYDLFGVSPDGDESHPMSGLYRFKSGFGGKMFHTMGCWDYPLRKEEYSYFRAFELKSQGYHLS